MQEIIRARRSIRRFERTPVPEAAMLDILEAARLSPTGSNAQPLRFIGIRSADLCEKLFAHLRWAGHLPDGSASPTAETQPAAYVVLLVDKNIRAQSDNDAGAAAMSMMLSAQAHGVASCWLGAVDRAKIAALLDLDAERFQVHTVIALGYPAQTSRAVPMDGENVKYYLEAPDKLCVPKRKPEDVYQIR
ncbi:MAG TPA: nitroreductase family protein [Clostridia bacterium]|nr:nitroreductase family protein [Clostridia bacterium]